MPPFDPETRSFCVCAVVSGGFDNHNLFGFAVFDEEQRRFQLCEYHEDTHMSRSEAILLQVQPRSCCMMLTDQEHAKKLGRIAESCGVELTEAKSAEVKQVDASQDLLRLLSDTEGCGLGRHLEEQRKKQGMKALAALIGHFAINQEPGNWSACTLGLYPLRSFMYLDKAAFSALNVLPRPEESLRSSSSLLGFLNRCRSVVGTRRLRQWLTQPLTSPEEISRRHDVVEALSGAEELLRQIEAQLRHVPDLERMAARLHRTVTKSKWQKATLEDVVMLYQCVRGTETTITALGNYNGTHREILNSMFAQPLGACLSDFQNFRALVEQTVDLKQAEQRNYCISTAFDASLGRLAQERDKVWDQMEVVRAKIDKALGISGKNGDVSLTEITDGRGSVAGHALRVTKKHQQVVEKYKGKETLKVLNIKKTELVFTTSELENLNKQWKHAIEQYDQQSSQLVEKTLTVASTYSPVVERLSESLGSLDVLCAFARVASNAPCTFVRARLDPEATTFTIQGASHVLVVANSDKGFIANDLHMKKDESRLHIITGPNMGGKSTYIRSIALIALMNQIGSFVPCQSAVLPVFDAVMCRVGASDMQLRGISTFMAEMLEAACILNTATERSLVIVDELGRGTSTADGFGIAWAIAKTLVQDTRCFSLFATHFHELATLEDAVPGVRNRHATAAVDASSGRLTFLYALAHGSADQSYGAHVADLAGFPQDVVAAARRRSEEFEAGGAFGRSTAKRQRVSTETVEDPMEYILASRDEDEFARRALEQLPRLRSTLPAPPQVQATA